MAAKIETAFLINTEPGTESASVDESTPAVGAVSSALWSSNCENLLTDQAREQAIQRASELMGYFEAEYRLFWTLWTRDGLFDQKAAYDIAMSNYLRAKDIRNSLTKGKQ